VLAAEGIDIVGEPDETRRRQWSLITRIPTTAGPMWAKANARGFAHEGPLISLLAQYHPELVLAPMAVDADRGWLLTPDGGPTFDSSAHDWNAVVGAYALLQQELASRIDDLRTTGTPFLPPDRLVDIYRLYDDDPAIVTAIEHQAGVLTESGRLSLEHNDLHPGNVFGASRLFDWGDAVITHPFLSVRMFGGDWTDEYFAHWRRSTQVSELEIAAARKLAPLIGLHPWSRIDNLSGPFAEFVDDLLASLRRGLLE
jgi:hypothetical protein